jgi:hypothetical protein
MAGHDRSKRMARPGTCNGLAKWKQAKAQPSPDPYAENRTGQAGRWVDDRAHGFTMAARVADHPRIDDGRLRNGGSLGRSSRGVIM